MEEPPASLADTANQQDHEAAEFATQFLKTVLRLRGVRIEREAFLRSELHKRGLSESTIAGALKENPAAAGVPVAMLDDIASSAIAFETRKSSAFSFAAGLPGGFAMLGTVPADITQFYVHAFRVMQKIAYTYGWQSFLKDTESIDDETLGKLASFLGVMMGVGGASASVTTFAAQVARPAIQKQIAGQALTKTSWYLPMKQTLKLVGVQITKQSFAKATAKVVPVVGGVISGGLTFVTLGSQSKRLQNHLREIPPPNVDAAEYLAALFAEDDESSARSLKTATGGVIRKATDPFRSIDLDGDGTPDEARALTTAKDATSAARGALRGAAQRLRRSKTTEPGEADPVSADEE
ncbi:hypothetical protein C8E99_2072 [Citricoccus muralis]|uniref:EcsC family protein n=2 Tax=Citricoccus muralis TaxID=169134 RepID=A0A3D9LDE0_9MICC|nr:hypothetical protein C8E99_2072 [Citricoccus muralis]